LRDFIQSHLVQVLSMVTMEAPAAFDSDRVHAAKEAALGQVQPVPPDKLGERAIRGQYKGYREEVNDLESNTETYAEITVYSQAGRWHGVPFKMLTGKALDERRAEVVVNWRDEPATHISMEGHTRAYERVLADAVRGDHTIFSTKAEILDSWRILQPVVQAWQHGDQDLIIYEPGSPGPRQNGG
jgi:glucose-6-phosphate 1-dehydrogenase